MLYLVEDFFSIQGEGLKIGTPSIFFRFGGCNLTCSGFGCTHLGVAGCDTVYAVDKKHFVSNWQVVTADELITKVISYQENLTYKPDIVITGGEPLMYANNIDFITFLNYLNQNNHTITIETNGTFVPSFKTNAVYQKIIYALSIKLKNSGEKREKRLNTEAIKTISTFSPNSFFKFVVDQESIKQNVLNEINEIITIAPHLKVYCMPLSNSKKTIEKQQLSVIQFCLKNGFIYSDRLHIRIWDQQKGF